MKNLFAHKKTTWFGFFLVMILLDLWGFFIADRLSPDVQIIYGSGADFQVFSFDDRSEGGLSEHSQKIDSNGLYLSFDLSGAFSYPYAGGGLTFSENPDSCLNFEKFDSLEIRWKLEGWPLARLSLKTFDSVRSSPSQPESYRVLMNVVPLHEQWRKDRFALSDWSVPPWWYQKMKITPNAEERYTNRVCALEWDVPGEQGNSAPGQLEISEIRLIQHKNKWFFWLLLGISFTLIFSYIRFVKWVFFTESEKLKRTPIETSLPLSGKSQVEIKGVEIQSDWEKLDLYLNENYQNSELSAEDLCRHFGWNHTKFAQIVKHGCGTNFKQKLNQLRITEAQNHLLNGDEAVSTIAEAVGFKSPSHFNRVFKEIHGVSPSEYRKKD